VRGGGWVGGGGGGWVPVVCMWVRGWMWVGGCGIPDGRTDGRTGCVGVGGYMCVFCVCVCECMYQDRHTRRALYPQSVLLNPPTPHLPPFEKTKSVRLPPQLTQSPVCPRNLPNLHPHEPPKKQKQQNNQTKRRDGGRREDAIPQAVDAGAPRQVPRQRRPGPRCLRGGGRAVEEI
jgi:hypothetical protein